MERNPFVFTKGRSKSSVANNDAVRRQREADEQYARRMEELEAAVERDTIILKRKAKDRDFEERVRDARKQRESKRAHYDYQDMGEVLSEIDSDAEPEPAIPDVQYGPIDYYDVRNSNIRLQNVASQLSSGDVNILNEMREKNVCSFFFLFYYLSFRLVFYISVNPAKEPYRKW